MKYDIDGTGELEYICSAYTTYLYEQEFGVSLIADFYGRVDLGDDSGEVVTAEFVENRLAENMPVDEKTGKQKPLPKATSALVRRAFPQYVNTVIDYTKDRWDATLRVMWAMRKTACDVAGDACPTFKQWLMALGQVNMRDTNFAAFEETQRGLFHTRS